jgi:hypothetical protein
MTIKLSETDHNQLTVTLDTLLDAFAGARITRIGVREAFANMIAAAALGNEGTLRTWLMPELVEHYLAAFDAKYAAKNTA